MDESTERTKLEQQQKTYSTILDEEIEEAILELERPSLGLLLSGLSAGLDLGFSALFVALVVTLAGDYLSRTAAELLRANAYAIGFVFVIFGRSELFTEHTTLAFLPVLDGRARLREMARLWGIVYAANLAGGAIFAGLLAVIGPALGIIAPSAFGLIAQDLLSHPPWVILASGVLAGWLMGLVSWLVTAGRDTASEIFFVWLVTACIGLAQLHHCVLGTIEVLAAIFARQDVSLTTFASFLLYATLGNIIGGVIFVALIKYGHATQVRRGMRHS